MIVILKCVIDWFRFAPTFSWISLPSQFRIWSFWNDKLYVLGKLVRHISLLYSCSWNKRSLYCLICLPQIRSRHFPAMIRSVAFVLVVLVIGNLGFSINGKNKYKMLMLPKLFVLLLNIYSRILTLVIWDCWESSWNLC